MNSMAVRGKWLDWVGQHRFMTPVLTHTDYAEAEGVIDRLAGQELTPVQQAYLDFQVEMVRIYLERKQHGKHPRMDKAPRVSRRKGTATGTRDRRRT